jgi:hypothetical protein
VKLLERPVLSSHGIAGNGVEARMEPCPMDEAMKLSCDPLLGDPARPISLSAAVGLPDRNVSTNSVCDEADVLKSPFLSTTAFQSTTKLCRRGETERANGAA